MATTRKSTRQISISVYFVKAILKNVIANGLDPVQLLRDNRISPRLLQENEARISVERYADLQVAVMKALGDEALAYGPSPFPLGTWSMMCHAVIGSDTLGKALARYCRFFSLFHGEDAPKMIIKEGLVMVRVGFQELRGDQYLGEMSLFNCHRFLSWLVAEHLPVQSFNFQYDQPPHVDEYRPMFLSNPVHFGSEHTEMVLNRALLDRPVVQTEESLTRFLRHPVLTLLTQQYDHASWTSRVKEFLKRDLTDIAELDTVASEMDIHPQTLRRRLSKEGTSFSEIKSQLRRDVSLYYLGKRGLSIEEIAHRSGFSESSAFIRAFKGWTGVTPYTYRKGL